MLSPFLGWANGLGTPILPFETSRMPDPESRRERRDRQQREIEDSQRELRESIANTQRLLDQSDEMLKRHRRETEEDDAD